jgi:hypothetical protein
MEWTEENKERAFKYICSEIAEGRPAKQIFEDEGVPSHTTFYKWLNEDDILAARYAQACKVRAEKIFEEIMEIADNQDDLSEMSKEDSKIIVARNRLQIDTRKWALSKMQPEKYGDRIAVDAEVKGKIQFENVSKQFPDKD